MANRQERIITLIGKNLRDIVQFEVKNSKIGFVTITDIEVSNDLSHAKVFVSFLGTKYPKQNLSELEKCKGFIRSCLAKKMDTRKVPDLTFILDDSFDKAKRLEEILNKDQEEIEKFKK